MMRHNSILQGYEAVTIHIERKLYKDFAQDCNGFTKIPNRINSKIAGSELIGQEATNP